MSGTPPPIQKPYLLVCPIAHFRHPDGSIWLDPLWHHDLIEHYEYLNDLVLVSPERPFPDDRELTRLDFPTETRLEVVALPAVDSMLQGLRALPETIATFWKTIGRVEFVHSGIIGWPIPLGWIANPITLLRRKKLIINIESAFWRIPEGQTADLRKRTRARVTEFLGRFFVNHADLSLFSQPAYRDSLLTRKDRPSGITPASWISEDDILSEDEATSHWAPKQAGPTRLLFAARLVPEKGVHVLLEALDRLDEAGVPLALDIIGEGPLLETCKKACDRLDTVQARVLPPVPYGEAFFELVQYYHAIVMPNLSDEQPRLIFDAFAQAVPILCSDTDGLRPHVVDGETGRLCAPGDASALARILEEAVADPQDLHRMGCNAHAAAHELTHRAMHHTRWRSLHDVFGDH